MADWLCAGTGAKSVVLVESPVIESDADCSVEELLGAETVPLADGLPAGDCVELVEETVTDGSVVGVVRLAPVAPVSTRLVESSVIDVKDELEDTVAELVGAGLG